MPQSPDIAAGEGGRGGDKSVFVQSETVGAPAKGLYRKPKFKRKTRREDGQAKGEVQAEAGAAAVVGLQAREAGAGGSTQVYISAPLGLRMIEPSKGQGHPHDSSSSLRTSSTRI